MSSSTNERKTTAALSRDQIRKVGKRDPWIKVMAPRRLFPGFPGIKEAPHLFKPPLRLQRERETPLTTILAILKRRTPPRYIYTYIHILFVSLSRETRKFRSILETKEGRDDKPIIASRRRRGSSNRFQFTGRQSLAGQMGKQSWGRCSTIISVLESRTSTPRNVRGRRRRPRSNRTIP